MREGAAGTDPADSRARLRALPPLEAARALLGWRFVRDDETGRRVGRIVELEAYLGEDDRASHARFGRTARNAVMFGPPGRAYVYLVYGMHDCLNIVTGSAGEASALLVRAIEPLEGAPLMRASRERRARERRRGAADDGVIPARVPDARLAAGPGLVCAAFDVDRSLTGRDLLEPTAPIRLEPPPPGEPRPAAVTGPRVGIAFAGEPWASALWRLAIAGHPSVSRPAPLAHEGLGRP